MTLAYPPSKLKTAVSTAMLIVADQRPVMSVDRVVLFVPDRPKNTGWCRPCGTDIAEHASASRPVVSSR